MEDKQREKGNTERQAKNEKKGRQKEKQKNGRTER